jgi:hypothetical protein
LVALKKVVVFEIPNRHHRNKCLQEIRILRRCEHPCVIRCFDAWLEDGELCIQLELGAQGDLSRLIRDHAATGMPEQMIWFVPQQ